MESTLLNKLILIFVIFLIGVSVIDGFNILTPKIIEGNTNEAIGSEAMIHKHTGQIAMLKDELDTVSELKKEIDKTNVELAATNKILEKHQGNIDQLIEANAATNGAGALDPSKK
mgnify:FL=1|tara:strand:- start:190 stop:534 length:345 start_codon:yes stop_codon:yes gene_type:complete